MARKSGLGRGLDALILGSDTAHLPGVQQIPVGLILPNPRQPRNRVDPQELAELAASIQEHGVLQPLILTRGQTADEYILIAGERRLMAARQAGLESVPAILREATDRERLEIALIENLQRADLGPLEEAEAYRQLVEDFNLSHEEVASHVGKSRAAVTNTLRLLKLSAAVQQALADEQISEGHGRALLGLNSASQQGIALQAVLKRSLNVRQTETLVSRLNEPEDRETSAAARAPEIVSLEERLRSSLGTKVSLNPSRKGGTVVIHYFSDEELNAIVERILGEVL